MMCYTTAAQTSLFVLICCSLTNFFKHRKTILSGMLSGPNKSGNLINIDDEGASGGGAQSGQMAGQSKTQMLLQEEQNLQELQERERSVHQLESDIVDMNTIFKDLATMVHEQGEMVDSIEVHVSEAQVRVGEGTQQLRQAEQYKVSNMGTTFFC